MLATLLALVVAAGPGGGFMDDLLAPGPAPQQLTVRSEPAGQRSWSYDAALAALWLVARGRPDDAGKVLLGLAAAQAPDGAIPFSFDPAHPHDGQAYVRSGAMAWVGYAAARYLDAGRQGPGRDQIAAMAHRIAHYLLVHRVDGRGDPRDGLILGGSGRYDYAENGAELQERFIPGEVAWASTEHNIDSWFFLRELARVTDNRGYAEAAQQLGKAIVARLWNDGDAQFYRGADASAPDTYAALDCASWGAIFLDAYGDVVKAYAALATAERRYGAQDPRTHLAGHRPYADTPVYESAVLRRHFAGRLPARDWNQLPAIWPEGSAGVALAALRLGKVDRARAIVADLDRMRLGDGGLPCLSVEIPYEFTGGPTLAGTAWVELVRAELGGWRGIWARS